MRIVDHEYFGSESEVGSLIPCDRFAVAQIKLQLPLHAGLLWEVKKFGEHRTNGFIPIVGGILVTSEQVWNLKKTKDNGSPEFSTKMSYVKAVLLANDLRRTLLFGFSFVGYCFTTDRQFPGRLVRNVSDFGGFWGSVPHQA
jgi:hypothetical protein